MFQKCISVLNVHLCRNEKQNYIIMGSLPVDMFEVNQSHLSSESDEMNSINQIKQLATVYIPDTIKSKMVKRSKVQNCNIIF